MIRIDVRLECWNVGIMSSHRRADRRNKTRNFSRSELKTLSRKKCQKNSEEFCFFPTLRPLRLRGRFPNPNFPLNICRDNLNRAGYATSRNHSSHFFIDGSLRLR